MYCPNFFLYLLFFSSSPKLSIFSFAQVMKTHQLKHYANKKLGKNDPNSFYMQPGRLARSAQTSFSKSYKIQRISTNSTSSEQHHKAQPFAVIRHPTFVPRAIPMSTLPAKIKLPPKIQTPTNPSAEPSAELELFKI